MIPLQRQGLSCESTSQNLQYTHQTHRDTMMKFTRLKFSFLLVPLLLMLAGCSRVAVPTLEAPSANRGRADGTMEIVVTVLDFQDRPLEGMLVELVDMTLDKEAQVSQKTNVRGVAKLSRDVYIGGFNSCIVRVQDSDGLENGAYAPWYGTLYVSKGDFIRKVARKELLVHLERLDSEPSAL